MDEAHVLVHAAMSKSKIFGWRRYWPLLFPLTTAVHMTEEYFGGFPAWATRYLGFHLTTVGWLELNVVAWIVVLGISVFTTWRASQYWLVLSLASVTVINACAHMLASGITATYSPGIISGLILWLPLGALTLYKGYKHLPHFLVWAGISVGVLLHVLVTVLAFAG